jgi:hypothetical protein
MECARTVYRMPCLNEDTQSWAIANWSEAEAESGDGLGRCLPGTIPLLLADAYIFMKHSFPSETAFQRKPPACRNCLVVWP